MIVWNIEDLIETKNTDLEPKVTYQSWMFFLFEILPLVKGEVFTFHFLN